MSFTKTIFSRRCKKCSCLVLKSETNHKCEKLNGYRKITKRHISSEIKLAFENLDEPSLIQSQISHFLNKFYGYTKYTQYEIRYYLDKHPSKFKTDKTRSTKYDKYFTYENIYRQEIKTAIKSKTEYHIQPPRSDYGLTYSIKKITITGANRTETTLAIMVYGKKLAEFLLKKCQEISA